MALYDINSLKTLYTKIGNKIDTCYLCEKVIRQKYNDREITLDEMHNEINKLSGQLNTKKVAYIEHSGITLYICKECLNKINKEIGISFNKNSNINTKSNIEENKENNTDTKIKINLKKGNKNASKQK